MIVTIVYIQENIIARNLKNVYNWANIKLISYNNIS